MRSFRGIALAAGIVLLPACSVEVNDTHTTPEIESPSPHAAAPVPAAPMANPHGAPPTPHPPTSDEVSMGHGGVDISASTKQGTTVISEEVANSWRGATFILVDREGSEAGEFSLTMGDEYPFGGGKLKLVLHHFIPDLRIEDNRVYTSVSNDPNNPAAHVSIFENGGELFDGWLFSEFPGVHMFEHARFGLTLKEGLRS